MCTLHIFYKLTEDAPVLFAGNRDEILGRQWAPPDWLPDNPTAFGPRDLVAGGTWLGVNRAGVLVSLANHYGTLTTGGGGPCSRGAIVLEALRRESADEARQFVEHLAPACKAYTLLVADRRSGYVVDHSPGATRTYPLLPGCHVITNDRFGDKEDAKARRSLRRMEELRGAGRLDPEDLFGLLADHEKEAPDSTPLCAHPQNGDDFGTSSASVVQIDGAGHLSRFLFAPGPPCSTRPVDVTPLRGISAEGDHRPPTSELVPDAHQLRESGLGEFVRTREQG